ncbi:MAG: hypothetical protein AMXMBFR13_46350 [Phycisphaerae bacterium]
MKLVITADLHYDITRSREPARAIADEICSLSADVLLVLGDIAGRDLAIVREALGLFDRFRGRKLFVAGNHDVWTEPGGDSLARFDTLLPALCREAGFHPLDVEPLLIDDVGLVGSMGWYDYSFRPQQLGIPLRFYEEKVAPGAACRLERYAHLVADRSDIPEAALGMGTRWMDGEHVRLGMSDTAFCARLLDRFRQNLAAMAQCSQRIIAATHHVPFRELVPFNANPGWAFAGAFLGSEAFGEALLAEPKVTHAYCGHSHSPGHLRRGYFQCINVGCTYVAKRYEILEI